MRRAYSVNDILSAKFRTLDFDGEWLRAIGRPEPSGAWLIYGLPKNGKTSFAMMLAKYLTRFCRVAYDSFEEGFCRTMQLSLIRNGMAEAGRRMILLDGEGMDDLCVRLDRQRSPEVIIIDSLQYLGISYAEYKALKERYPKKLFIFISHMVGGKPDGATARKLERDASVVIRVEGFRAFPTGRYGGDGYIDIWKERADTIHGTNIEKAL